MSRLAVHTQILIWVRVLVSHVQNSSILSNVPAKTNFLLNNIKCRSPSQREHRRLRCIPSDFRYTDASHLITEMMFFVSGLDTSNKIRPNEGRRPL